MNPIHEAELAITRRQFFGKSRVGIGVAALGALLGSAPAAGYTPPLNLGDGSLGLPHFAPKAKRVIYLFQSGGPSQYELFDYKPRMIDLHGTELPDSIRGGQRITGMTSGQDSFPVVGSHLFPFQRHGESGAWVSELMPHTAKVVDDLCFLKAVNTEAINHDPGITFLQTGHQQPGRPSLGAWMSYGLGSLNQNLPSFVVLITRGKGDQPLYARLWGSGFLPAEHQGVQFRAGEDAVLHLANPEGVSGKSRRMLLDRFREMHEHAYTRTGDDNLDARIEQYEMAFRMQSSVPDVTDLSDEPDHIFEEYGPDSRTPGTFAANCLLARRLAERDVQFIQLYHRGWDQHGNLPSEISLQSKETDQPSAALVRDLKRRGLLEDTLVIWGGEFGRTSYSQGPLTEDNYGRDHHPRCFTVWMAGGGVKPGLSYGVTDDFSYNIVENPVHVHDFHATLLHLMGIDHERLTYRFQGRRFRLTDVHGDVVKGLLA